VQSPVVGSWYSGPATGPIHLVVPFVTEIAVDV